MSSKKVLGIMAIMLGLALIFSSFYIKSRVVEGRKEISEAEKKVKQGEKLFSLNPVTKEVGKAITGGVQEKIDEGALKADQYDKMALWFQIGGVVFILVGAGVLVAYRKK